MRNYLNTTRLMTKLKMLRSGKKNKSFLLVEGVTDLRLYGKFIDQKKCDIIISDSKHNVKACIMECNAEDIKGILGIVDRDFDGVKEEYMQIPNLFRTDLHDLECMLLASAAYHEVLMEYADFNKCARFEASQGTTIREYLLKQSAICGYLRWYSLEKALGLRFSELDFKQFINVKNMEVNRERLIQALLFHSKKEQKLAASLKEALSLFKPESYDLWQICCGHDLMEIMTIGLVNIWGGYNAKMLFPGQLEGNFRLAYSFEYFKKTKIYNALKNWEMEQSGYVLFKSEQEEVDMIV